ncbi:MULTISPECIES: bacteriocin immunity protein [Streptomyces]|uniref:bacteriocin immunity protein n=1 Tax=Streptomyces TaxID=1883 RepID=UPI001CCD4F2E|nr:MULTISPECIES: bacteriocin immunity protein [Streptomyces]UBI38901.1 bacteriocin immunity protein [Streptomyces mobaraensis]UKW31480.1 bacteriocin immunity protein [Streptomyces sp. TYQ1024]
MTAMERDGLVRLVRRIMDGEGASEAEHDALVAEFERSVLHPAVIDLMYHQRPELSAEQVVDAALAYRPIAL